MMDQPLMVTNIPQFAALPGPLSSERGKPETDVQGWGGSEAHPHLSRERVQAGKCPGLITAVGTVLPQVGSRARKDLPMEKLMKSK